MNGGIAGTGAALITHPIDVINTKVQVQKTKICPTISTVLKKDGLAGLHAGIVPALWFHLLTNGIRLGLYQEADRAWKLRNKASITKIHNSLGIGAASGAVATVTGRPLLFARTEAIISPQHCTTCTAIGRLYRKCGLKALWQGTARAVLRNSASFSTQITSFSLCKDYMDRSAYFQQHSKYWTTFLASNLAALVESVTSTPIDNVTWALFNKPVDLECKGKRIKLRGLGHCARTIAVTEGLNAFYKGFFPYYLRQAPQSVLLLLLWDSLLDRNESFIET